MIIDCINNQPLPYDLYGASSLQILTEIARRRGSWKSALLA